MSDQENDSVLTDIGQYIGAQICPQDGWLVLPWDSAPFFLREACNQGGDEDYLILGKLQTMEYDGAFGKATIEESDAHPYWVERLAGFQDPAIIRFKGFVVYVITH